MAYRFKLDEPIQAGVRRIGTEQIDLALNELAAVSGSASSIHEARKSFKRIRALLRLVRPAIGEVAFRRENAFYRETSALLSHVRDREILLETAIKLEARFADPPVDSLVQLHKLLAAAFDDGIGEDAIAAARTEAAARLRKARSRFTRLTLAPNSFGAIAAGLEQNFRRASKHFEHACERPSSESVHDWRKGVQQHWRHMLLLRRAWPEMADARMHAARKLSQILGDDHDLAVLQQHIETAKPAGLTARDVRTITRLALQRQDELRERAKPLGAKLFADRPRSLARRFEVYWTAAVDLSALRATSRDGETADS